MKKIIYAAVLVVFFSSCLKTRSEVSEQDQNYTYGKKNADNQAEAKANSNTDQNSVVTMPAVDEKDELIRNLNGRVETLENQLQTLQKEKEAGASENSQKIVLLQEALTKMEAQIQKLESDSVSDKENDKVAKASDEEVPVETGKGIKKLNAYEAGEQYFTKQEWKKAILNFQKYADTSPKGKNVAEAKFKIGASFQELGMKEEAMAFYEEVVANYSKTEAGKKAKSRLTKLKK